MNQAAAHRSIATLQALRALAALMIVVFHAVIQLVEYPEYSFTQEDSLAAGVDMFFVISGFIIYLTGRRASPGTFLARRAIRVVPPYWLYTTVTAALLLFVPSAYRNLRFDARFAMFSYAFLFSPNVAGAPGTLLGVGWSLAYEMYFYVLFALLLCLPRKWLVPGLASALLAGALLSLTVPVSAYLRAPLSTLPLEFLLGCLLAKWYVENDNPPPSKPVALALFAVGGIGIWLAGHYLVGPGARLEFDVWRVLFFGIPAMLVVTGGVLLEPHVRVPRFVQLVGDASYSLYLSHSFVLAAVVRIWRAAGLSFLPGLLLVLLSSCVAIVVGISSYYLFEKPVTKALSSMLLRSSAEPRRGRRG